MADYNSIPPVTPELAERFWTGVSLTSAGCWEWNRARDGNGYGAFKIYGKQYRASRVAAAFSGLLVEGDACVLHRCDNTACVRPTHLFVGSHADNAADRNAKGRQARGPAIVAATVATRARGSRVNTSKLSADQVMYIRAAWAAGASAASLGRRFRVATNSVRLIVIGRNWKHLPLIARQKQQIVEGQPLL